MPRKVLFFLFLFSLFFPSQSALAACRDPVIGPGGRRTCVGLTDFKTNCIGASGFPEKCCQLPTECPSGAKATSVGTDGVYLFCDYVSPASGIRTAIGCIQAQDPIKLINQIVFYSVSVASGLSLATLFYAGFIMATAKGDPKRVKEAWNYISSTLTGLLIIIISVVLINFIGIRILDMVPLGFHV